MLLSELREKERRLVAELEQTREQIRLASLCDACNRRGIRCGRLKYQGGLFCSIHAGRTPIMPKLPQDEIKCHNRNGILIYTRDGKELDVDVVLSMRPTTATPTMTMTTGSSCAPLTGVC
jgi:hypothetical protein